ncbi:MAG: type I pullulanase [Lachnospiraceae bacterium]|nr:type I pullulanase [Lachnospiraceae bacterium]MDY5742018.1 type I pullulanase [Lachnospiraceae bacterium]
MKRKSRRLLLSWLIVICMLLQPLLPFAGDSRALAKDLEYATATENKGEETVTFRVRYTDGDPNPAYSYVVGEFNEWKYDPKYKLEWKQDPSDDNRWKMLGTIAIPAGTYEYKFRVHYGNQNDPPGEGDQWIKPTGGSYASNNDNGLLTISPKETGIRFQASRNTVSAAVPTYLAVDYYAQDGAIEALQPTYSIEPTVVGAEIDQNGKLTVTEAVADQQEVTVVAVTPRGRAVKTLRVIKTDTMADGNRVHYHRYDSQYEGWNVWSIPAAGDGKQVDFSEDSEFGKIANLKEDKDSIIRKGDWKGRESRATLSDEDLAAGRHDLYVIEGDDRFYTDFRQAVDAAKPKVITAIMDSEREIKAYLTHVPTELTKFALYVDGQEKEATITVNDKTLTVTLPENVTIDPSSLLEIRADKMFNPCQVMMRRILDHKQYTGDDLGAVYKEDRISLKLWAPTANKVSVLVYSDAEAEKSSGAVTEMQIDEAAGVWSVELPRTENEGKYYLYRLDFYDQVENSSYKKQTYAVDPYATAVGINGDKAAFIDPQDPQTIPDGWNAVSKPAFGEPEDAVIYEMHVRDFTIDATSGVSAEKRGKFLGVVEQGTTVDGKGQVKTGLDHLKELGITHVHLIPVYDFATVDEKVTNDPANRNWGYDPKNYNAIEGSYATNAADPKVRIKEYRQMIQGLHDANIRVVMDVVYNHMHSTANMDAIVPGYYFRTDDLGRLTDGSGCGNEVASDRPMVRKFIIDSCRQWAKNYNIDGLRFDLMSLIDIETMKQATAAMKAIDPTNIIYGEPWAGGVSALPIDRQTLDGQQKNQHFGVFNDTFRDALRGNNDPGKGYINANAADTRESVKKGLMASVNDFTADPEETINYVDVHDNYNLWDQLALTLTDHKKPEEVLAGITADTVMDNQLVQRALLGQGLVLTAQGVPLTQAGTEFLRTKKGDGNSYRSPDEINAIRWNQKETFAAVNAYVEGLIKLRKEHPAFRLRDAQSVNAHVGVWNAKHKPEIVLMHLKENAGGDSWKNIFVIYNPTDDDYKFTESDGTALPDPDGGCWQVVVDHKAAGTTSLRQVDKYGIVIRPRSMMVLYDRQEEVDKLSWSHLFADQSKLYISPMAPKSSDEVTVRFRAKAGEVTEAKLHYYDEGNKTAGDQSLAMTKVTEQSFYQANGFDPSKIEFWEGKLPAGATTRYYNFEVHSQDDVAWISGGVHKDGSHNGVTKEAPRLGEGINYGFRIVPDYVLNTKLGESIFYQIMVDRFRNGDTGNDRSILDPAVGNDPLKRSSAPEILAATDVPRAGTETDLIWNNDFYNGDLTGVREALPYLKDQLGVNALYLMPILQSSSNHKYDTEDYEHVDTNFGGNKELAALTDEAHAKDVQVVLDGVFNHTGSLHPWFSDAKATDASAYRNYYFFNSGHDVEGGYYAWNRIPGLPKLNYANEAVENYMYKADDAIVKKYLKAPYSIDGWRMDAADDIAKGAHEYTTERTVEEHKQQNLEIWKDVYTAVKATNPEAYVLGEFWKEDNQWFDGAHWDGKMNYSGFLLPFVQNRQQNEFLGKQSLDNKGEMSVADIAAYGRSHFAKFPYQAMLQSANSLSTHDRPRFLDWDYTGKDNEKMMELAAALQMTYVGIPMIYYGDEIGMKSAGERTDKPKLDDGNDPYNRGAFNWDVSTWNKEMLSDYQKLIAARKQHKEAFVYGAFEEVVSHKEDKYLVYARYGQNDRALVALNNSGSNSSRQVQIKAVSRYGFKEGEVLYDALTGRTVTVVQDQLQLQLNDMSAAVYLPAPVEVTPIQSALLAEKHDGRTELAPVQELILKLQEDGSTQLSWKKYEDSHAKELLIRAYDEKFTVVREVTVSLTESAYTLEANENISRIAIKAVADRSKTEGDTDDIVRDSAYRLAYVRAVDPKEEAEDVPVDGKIAISLDTSWKLTREDLKDVKLKTEGSEQAVEVELTLEEGRLILSPKQSLIHEKTYTVTLPDIAIKEEDMKAGNAGLAGYQFSFRTVKKTDQIPEPQPKKGWQKLADGHYIYLNEDGSRVKEAWRGEYYLKADGIMADKEWIYDKTYQAWYYLKPGGAYARAEWQGSYYLKPNGKMADKEWIYDKTYQAWYYLKPGGAYARLQWQGEYYLLGDGKMAVSRWIYDKQYQGWYYLTETGAYVRDTLTPDGYKVDRYGKWIR